MLRKNEIYTIEKLYDDESTREKATVLTKLEVIFDDSRNDTDKFWIEILEQFLQFGHTYKIIFNDLGESNANSTTP